MSEARTAMWLLRRKTAVSETSGEVLQPLTAPMRRVEITVERQTVTRLSRGSGAVPEEQVEVQFGLAVPGGQDGGRSNGSGKGERR